MCFMRMGAVMGKCLPELGSPDKMEALSATTQVNENDDGSDKQLGCICY